MNSQSLETMNLDLTRRFLIGKPVSNILIGVTNVTADVDWLRASSLVVPRIHSGKRYRTVMREVLRCP